MSFPTAVETMRAGGSINAGILHYLNFTSGAKRVWHGFGTLRTSDGLSWDGVGDVVTIEGGGQQAGVVASNMTLTVAANSDLLTDDIVAAALDSETEVYGRLYYMGLQFFDQDWQPVDPYRVIYVGVMDRMTFKRTADLRQIVLNVESQFVRRRTARIETFSYTDQQSKYVADKAFEFVSGNAAKNPIWPKY